LKRLAALALALVALQAGAQAYPSKPVRMVNPFPPGGPLDVLGRILSERLGASLGRPVLVENRPGAAGNVGAAEVARSPGDGHTLLLTLFSIVTSNPHLYERLPFDPLKDFAPITAIASSDSVLIVHPSVPVSSAQELVAFAKANPGKLNYSSAGKASPGHLTAEFFGRRTGAAFTHVPYKGKALREPQVEKALRAGRIFPIGNTPEEFGAMMREGHAAWGRVIRETGVKGE
jgi:tripartite-type tricarboxylate transporter receptor subunit TctC